MLAFAVLGLALVARDPLSDFNAGVAAEAKGDGATAIVLLDRAQQTLPAWALPKLELAEVLLKEGGAPDRALGLLDAAALLEPQNPRLSHLRGLAWMEKGNAAGAEAAERTALTLRPEFPEAEGTLAQALWDQHKSDEALAHWHLLVEKQPLDTARRALFVDRLLDSGRSVDAEKELRLLAAEQPRNPVWHRRLARALAAEGLAAEAQAEQTRAAVLAGLAPPRRKLRRLPDSRR